MISAWEPPEERIEHARPPRRRKRAAAPAVLDGQEPVPEESPEPETEGNGHRSDTPGVTKLFVNRGRKSGISEDDLLWALKEGAVLGDESIAGVKVLDRFSFVEVDSEKADRTVEFLDGSKLKGSEIRVEVARS